MPPEAKMAENRYCMIQGYALPLQSELKLLKRTNMKRSLTIAILTMFGMVCMAQSSEAGYPVGTWQSDPDGNEAFVDITIERISNPDPNFGNKKSCGVLSIEGKTPYKAMMTYAGRGLDKNGMCVDVFYFNVINKQSRTSCIGVQKFASTPEEYGNGVKIKIVSVTGDLANNPAMKQQLYAVGGGNGAAYDPTPFIMKDKELLDALQEGVGENWTMRGFGNARQYIAAHAKLTPGKPKYAKCKGAGSINIRKSGDANAEKIGELKPGTTLPVVDEYDGWCQVRMSDKQFGWVSLSVVALTNTPSATTTIGSTGTSIPETFVLKNGTLGPIQAGKLITNIPKSCAGLYDKYVYEKKHCEDMEGEWTEDHYYFYKNGKKVIDVWTENKKISAITLLPGSSYIKTPEGFYVGCSARDLFSKKRMEWSTYYDGYTFASSSKVTYYIKSGDLVGNVETPNKATDIKVNAKIDKIMYSVYVE